jgi:hypothetical protein
MRSKTGIAKSPHLTPRGALITCARSETKKARKKGRNLIIATPVIRSLATHRIAAIGWSSSCNKALVPNQDSVFTNSICNLSSEVRDGSSFSPSTSPHPLRPASDSKAPVHLHTFILHSPHIHILFIVHSSFIRLFSFFIRPFSFFIRPDRT